MSNPPGEITASHPATITGCRFTDLRIRIWGGPTSALLLFVPNAASGSLIRRTGMQSMSDNKMNPIDTQKIADADELRLWRATLQSHAEPK